VSAPVRRCPRGRRADGCSADPSTAVLGGPAPYWQSYAYDALGNRKTQVNHSTTSGDSDTTTSFVYPAKGTNQPHTLTSSTSVTGTTSTSDSYTYDDSGNTHTRTLNSKTQTLDWDNEGHLATVTNADGTSASYLYDADGNRLLTRDNTGTTLYLGDTEVHLAKGTTTTTGTRYYSWAGQTIAVRTSSGSLQWQVTDAHNTAETAVDATTQTATRRRLDPFGNSRGTQPTSTTWLGDKGFVNGIQETTTGLTHLGAREYDSTTGRFVSVDPVLELTDAQQIDGYTYAADNPISGSDPSGLSVSARDGGNATCTKSDGCERDVKDPAPSGTHHGGSGGGGGGCHWYDAVCGAKKAYHLVKEHPVIAAVVATAVVVGVVACVAATAGGCGAVLVAGAAGFAEGASAGLGAAVVGGATGVIAEGGAVIAGAMGIAGAGASAIAEGSETASKAESATASGAKASHAAAEDTAASGSAGESARAEKAAPKTGTSMERSDYDPNSWRPEVHHEEGATAIGNDPNTAKAMSFAPREPGVHNVVIHGNANGFANGTSVEAVADAVRSNPSYSPGMTCRLITCYGANMSYRLFGELRADVEGYNSTLYVNPDGSFAGAGEWSEFTMEENGWMLD
jgi:RHS repeat-associated protein